MASSDSCTASSMKPQVLTTTRFASSYVPTTSYPSARRRVRMRSESTSALGQPRETKPMRGGVGKGGRVGRSGRPGRPGRGGRAGILGQDGVDPQEVAHG